MNHMKYKVLIAFLSLFLLLSATAQGASYVSKTEFGEFKSAINARVTQLTERVKALELADESFQAKVNAFMEATNSRLNVLEASTPEPTPQPTPTGTIFSDPFSYPNGLITNEYAHWNPSSLEAVHSPYWEMTSGSFFAQEGIGWTGIPDGCSTSSPSSSPCTASDVFRLNTIRNDFGNVTVSLDLRDNYLTSSTRTPPVAWDGVHIWLHYQSEYNLYYASFNRRDGHIVIKKKCVGGTENGGTYYELAPGEVSGYAIPFGSWQHLTASIQDNIDGSVTITMSRDGVTLLTAVDKGTGCAPITAPGSVGVRGDNADFNIDNFTVVAN